MIQGKSGYYLVPLIRATGLYFYDNPDAFIEYGRRHNRLAPGQQQIINQHGQLEPAGWEKMKALVGYLRRLGELIRWCIGVIMWKHRCIGRRAEGLAPSAGTGLVIPWCHVHRPPPGLPRWSQRPIDRCPSHNLTLHRHEGGGGTSQQSDRFPPPLPAKGTSPLGVADKAANTLASPPWYHHPDRLPFATNQERPKHHFFPANINAAGVMAV